MRVQLTTVVLTLIAAVSYMTAAAQQSSQKSHGTPRLRTPVTGLRLTCWPWTVSRTPYGCAAFTLNS
jgi:hypothetical protein